MNERIVEAEPLVALGIDRRDAPEVDAVRHRAVDGVGRAVDDLGVAASVTIVVSSGSVAIETAYCAAPAIGAQRRISASEGCVDGVMNDAPSSGVVMLMTGAHLSATVRASSSNPTACWPG